MRVLVTGAGGWVGRPVVKRLGAESTVRAHDINPIENVEGAAEVTVGDLHDFDVVKHVVDGMEAVVHLVTAAGSSTDLAGPGDWISAGPAVAANVLEAAAELGVRRVVLMSSGAVVLGRRGNGIIDGRTAPQVASSYGLGKWLEEVIGTYYAAERGLVVPILRPWVVVDADARTFKGGRPLTLDDGDLFSHNGLFGWIDRGDVAKACQRALTQPLTGAPIFHLFASTYAQEQFDLAPARDILGWEPDHRFDTARPT